MLASALLFVVMRALFGGSPPRPPHPPRRGFIHSFTAGGEFTTHLDSDRMRNFCIVFCKRVVSITSSNFFGLVQCCELFFHRYSFIVAV